MSNSTTIITINGKLEIIPVFECYLTEEAFNAHMEELESDYMPPQKVDVTPTNNIDSPTYGCISMKEVYAVGATYCNMITNHVLNNAYEYNIQDVLYMEQNIPAYMRLEQRTNYDKPTFSPLYDKEITMYTVAFNMAL